jgi:hypothetical protein
MAESGGVELFPRAITHTLGGFFVASDERGVSKVKFVWMIAGLLVIITAAWHIVVDIDRRHSVSFKSPYQAVLLTNGSVYFGHLQGWGGNRPVLTDVFYIVNQTNPETKQVNNVLVKRGKELHGPDRMYLNPNQVLFVEPVGSDSRVAHLIAQAPR